MNKLVIIGMLLAVSVGQNPLSAQSRKGGIIAVTQDAQDAKNKIVTSADTTAHKLSRQYNNVKHDFKKTFSKKELKQQYQTFKDTMKAKWDNSTLKGLFTK